MGIKVDGTKEQKTIARLERYLLRKRGIRDALRDYRRARELTGRGFAWRQVKSTLRVFAGMAAPRTRVQLRNLLIRETYPLVERVAKDGHAATPIAAAAMTADFLRVAYPHVCDDVTPERVRTLIIGRQKQPAKRSVASLPRGRSERVLVLK